MTTTDGIFEAFLSCETKAFLKNSGTLGDRCEFGDWKQSLAEDFKRRCCFELRSHFQEDEYLSGVPLSGILATSKCRLATDCFVQTSDIQTNIHALERLTSSGKIQPDAYVPIRFVPGEKITRNDKLVLAFDTLALYSARGKMPPFAKIIHGSKQTTFKVQISAFISAARTIVGRIAAQQANHTPPQPILNRHCPECEFLTHCHQLAKEKDDLSLLSGMGEKERRKYRDKGIFTVTQLSYTFRARRKPKRYASKPDKYNHALKALAIRDNKVYVSGTPELKTKGTPVYLDVEGIPDRDFYYLIGLRIAAGDFYQQYSFWADDAFGERDIWISFLQTLAKIKDPQLIYYGSYETRFLKQMKKRYSDTIENPAFLDQLIKESVNTLSAIYGHIYFPTYSNGLKEIGRYLGFAWSSGIVSGVESIMQRFQWELSKDLNLKQDLIVYNGEDCEALQRVTDAITQLCLRWRTPTEIGDEKSVHIDSMKPDDLYRYSRKEFAISELKYINDAAYWDYQRERVYVRSSKRLKQATQKRPESRVYALPVDEIIEYQAPNHCPSCGSKDILPLQRRCKTVYDLKFSPGCVSRWVVRYSFHRYLCGRCGIKFYPQQRPWTGTKHGPNVAAYLMYQIVCLRLTHALAVQNIGSLFGLKLHGSETARQKKKVAQLYQDTYEEILGKIFTGKLVHADETNVSIGGKRAYVWVFTNLEEVLYLYKDTREGDFLQALLKDFRGVLVSDFYSAYDSMSCPQQKCLIHLMRDLNDALLKEPFNEELKELVHGFNALLRPMIETIDVHGLKSRFLQKHKASVERFYDWLSGRKFETDTAMKNKKRFQKNRDKLFTFIDYDGIPWNNNNAEHAIKAFARLRVVIGGTSSEDGIRDYLTLLSISQTCEYKGVSFLDFLCSGESSIDRFVEMRAAKNRRK